jgi:secreted trypsin-like serine protease
MKSFLAFFVILSSFLLVQCSPNNSSNVVSADGGQGIVNGIEVKQEDPLTKSIVMITDGKIALCTGTLIAQNIALTAAHCLEGKRKLYVGFSIDGSDKNVPKLKRHLVTAFKRIDGFTVDKNNNIPVARDGLDLMIVKFDGGTPDGYVPAELFESASIYPPELEKGAVVIPYGYGYTDMKKEAGFGPLRKTHVVIDEPYWGSTEFYTDEVNTGTCAGDSGGPAFLRLGDKFVVAAVTSRGSDNCDGYGIYTKVNAYTDWIKATVQELSK